jgi:hypothetical protein
MVTPEGLNLHRGHRTATPSRFRARRTVYLTQPKAQNLASFFQETRSLLYPGHYILSDFFDFDIIERGGQFFHRLLGNSS